MPRMISRSCVQVLFALCVLPLAGCGAVAVEAAAVAVDRVKVQQNIDGARAGDADAQYALGNARCCSGNAPSGTFYSTAEALTWLCAAAEQDNADAMLKLGRIFEGQQVAGLRLVRRAASVPFSTPMNRAAASYWYARAEAAGAATAARSAATLNRRMTPHDKLLAARYAATSTPPCNWSDFVTAAPVTDNLERTSEGTG